MAFFYTGVGDHHILQSPTPSWLKTIAEVSSWVLLVPVFAFTINILGTMKGNWDKFFTNLPLRFTLTAFFFYFLVNIQGAFEAIQPFNKLHALHELRRRARALSAARRVHDPRHGRDRLHGRADLRAAVVEPQPHRVAVLARHRRVHRLLQRAHARRLPAGIQLGSRAFPRSTSCRSSTPTTSRAGSSAR